VGGGFLSLVYGGLVVKKDKQNGLEKTDAQKEDPGLRNIAKIIFLVAVLVAAWFVLELLFEKMK
jgi:hypothetical protein